MMRCEMFLGLKDVPGSLIRALEPISSCGGNIISVLHNRKKANMVGVEVIFDVRDNSTLSRMIAELEARQVRVMEVFVEGVRYYSKKTLTFLLIGHVVDSDLRDTIDRINSLGLVRDVEVRMINPKDESSVLMRVNVSQEKEKKLYDELARICKSKKFALLGEVGS
jgi:ACT domain-containing protein